MKTEKSKKQMNGKIINVKTRITSLVTSLENAKRYFLILLSQKTTLTIGSKIKQKTILQKLVMEGFYLNLYYLKI